MIYISWETVITTLPSRLTVNGNDRQESLGEESSLKIDFSNIKAYPTIIVNDRVTLESTNIESINYNLIDLQGETLLQGVFNYTESNNRQIIKLPNLPSGTYILHLLNDNISKTIKLIKQ